MIKSDKIEKKEILKKKKLRICLTDVIYFLFPLNSMNRHMRYYFILTGKNRFVL